MPKNFHVTGFGNIFLHGFDVQARVLHSSGRAFIMCRPVLAGFSSFMSGLSWASKRGFSGVCDPFLDRSWVYWAGIVVFPSF